MEQHDNGEIEYWRKNYQDLQKNFRDNILKSNIGWMKSYKDMTCIEFSKDVVLFRATNSSTGDDVVLKLIQPTNQSRMKQIKNEILVLRKLIHPNIVRLENVFDCTEDSQLEHFAIEISPYLESKRPSYASGVGYWLYNVLQTLKYVHKKRIIHMDAHKGNILSKNQGKEILLIDFGISINTKEIDIDRTGVQCYMAPEIWNDYPDCYQGKLTTAYDIWSVGLTAYEYILKLEKPLYHGKDEEELISIYKDLDDSVFGKNLKHLGRPMHTEVICNMLKKNPKERMSAEQLLELELFQDPSFDELREMYD